MEREAAIAAAYEQVDSGAFFDTLARRIAVPTAAAVSIWLTFSLPAVV